MRREPLLPAARAAVFTAACVGLGVLAHRMMSGTAVPVWAMLIGAAGVFGVARFGSRRECGLPGIAVVMGAVQVGLHLLFGYAQGLAGSTASAVSAPAASGSGSTMPMSMPGMAMPAGGSLPMSGMPAMPMPAIPVHAVPGDGAGMHMGAGMLLAHALAALACAWWLHRGEAAVHELSRSAAHWIMVHLVVPIVALLGVVPGARQLCSPAEPIALALHSQWLRTVRAVRGPPLPPSFT
jgi:hypothetical protein